ncbi:hypothetical protein GQ53DRAFT_741985 [Thozetella sp. PMI_491]|nr:hypothetical protein GQ53DRAFT_741985 [Thozetella sp. PMI_491]
MHSLDTHARPRSVTTSTAVSWEELRPSPPSLPRSMHGQIDNKNWSTPMPSTHYGLQALFDTRATLLKPTTDAPASSDRPPASQDPVVSTQGSDGKTPPPRELRGSFGFSDSPKAVIGQRQQVSSQRSSYQRSISGEVNVAKRSPRSQLGEFVSPSASSVDLSRPRELSQLVSPLASCIDLSLPTQPSIDDGVTPASTSQPRGLDTRSLSYSPPGLSALFGHAASPAPILHAQIHELSSHRSVDEVHELEGSVPLPKPPALHSAASLPALKRPPASSARLIRPAVPVLQQHEGNLVRKWQESHKRTESNEEARSWFQRSRAFQPSPNVFPGS